MSTSTARTGATGGADDAPGGAGRAETPTVPIDRVRTEASLRTVAMPADANPDGDIFGGWILSQMDLAGGTFARYAAAGRVATVALTGMTFHKPVSVGDEISCYCRTERVGTTSVTVRVEAWVRPRQATDDDTKVTEGLFTFVALDTERRPRPIGEPREPAVRRVS